MQSLPPVCNSRRVLNEELTCSVCLEFFQNPVLLPCGHSFCRTCIDASCEGQPTASCPICRIEFLRGNYTAVLALASMVGRVTDASSSERIEAVDSCCNEQCHDHQEKFKLFCQDDGVLACVICRDALKHSKHSFLPIQDAVTVYKHKLTEAINPLKPTLNFFEDLKTKQESAISIYESAILDTKKDISAGFWKLRQALKEQEERMLAALQGERDAEQKKMEENLSTIEAECQKIQKTLDAAHGLLKEQDPMKLLKVVQLMVLTCSLQEMTTGLVKDRIKCLSPQRVNGPTEHIIWKQLKSVLSPTLFPFRFDAETAHRDLVVYRDATRVQYQSQLSSYYGYGLSYASKRFSVSLAVLGSKVFTTGKHYWEVDVGTKSAWIVGVTRNTTCRTEIVVLKPQCGTWALQLKNRNIYEALDDPPKVLCVATGLRKIGVYLDFPGKQVSFYNAEDMAHLHTFWLNSLVQLVPYFCPCPSPTGNGENPVEPLSICR